MALLVGAPVVSRLLPSPSAMADMGMHCDEHAGHGGQPSTPDPHAPSSMEKCGYCGLLGHSPVLGSALWLPPPRPLPSRDVMPSRAEPAATRRGCLVAAPRGPPVRVNA